MNYSQGGQVAGYYEPSLTVQFLPRCGNCSAAHPLARKPKQPADKCPDCGANVAGPGREIDVPAVIPGNTPSTLLARLLLAAGKRLFQLAQRH